VRKWREAAQNCVANRFIIWVEHVTCMGDIKMYEGKKNNLENLGVDGRILDRILKEYGVRMW